MGVLYPIYRFKLRHSGTYTFEYHRWWIEVDLSCVRLFVNTENHFSKSWNFLKLNPPQKPINSISGFSYNQYNLTTLLTIDLSQRVWTIKSQTLKLVLTLHFSCYCDVSVINCQYVVKKNGAYVKSHIHKKLISQILALCSKIIFFLG